MRLTALLPMKGHSERVPNKNIREMNGVPFFFYVARALEKCDSVDQIVINTDSELIAELAEKEFSKVKIHWRPHEICGDFVSMNDIIEYDLSLLDGEHFLQTHSTNPLLTSDQIQQAITIYGDSLDNYDSLFSVTQLQTRLYWQDGAPINHVPGELLRTQDLPPVFEENSNFYVFSKASFAKAQKNRIGVSPQMFVMNKLDAIDVDEEEDFLLAQELLKARA